MESPPDVVIEHRLPSVAEFRAVAVSVGWGDRFDWPSMRRSLDASLHAVVALVDGSAVGTARLVGDGVRYFYVQDVMVDPQHTDAGIASSMTQALIEWTGGVAAPGAFLGLFASPEAEDVYSALGFTTRDMTGMHRAPEPAVGPTDGD